ncbi:MAG: ABC transporter permease [Candidatus Nanopelagicales bacterium]|jgi:ABC-2 type transport system permease protein|nr:ABC transporter permease [Candidatus Nanopelagicales bacterium]
MSRTSSDAVVVHQREPFLRGFGSFVADVWAARTMLVSFVRKDLMIRYRGSALGIAWTMVKPLVQLLVFSLVMGYFLGFGDQIPAFGFYMFTGLMLFGLFADQLTGGATSVLWGAPVVKKVAFRRELLPLAAVGGALVNFTFMGVVLLLAYVVTRDFPNWHMLGLAVPALLITVLFGAAGAMLVSALNVYARDVQFLIDVGLLLMFWLTPVLYPWSTVQNTLAENGAPSWAFELYMLNPMANAVVAFQQALWPGVDEAVANAAAQRAAGEPFIADFDYFDSAFATRLWLMVLAGAVCLWFAQRVFARLQTGFATEL